MPSKVHLPILQTPVQKLTLVPELGGSVASWQKYDAKTKTWHDIFRPWDGQRQDGEHTGNFPIIPWNNRIAGGGFRHQGKFYPMKPNRANVGEPYPLHGDGWLQPWQVTEQVRSKAPPRPPKRAGYPTNNTDRTITLALTSKFYNESPYHYRGEQVFTLLDDHAYAHSLKVTNLGDESLPFSLGFHPWFIRQDAIGVDVNLKGIWATDPALNDARTPIKMIAPVPPDYATARINKANDRFHNRIDHIYYGWDGEFLLTTKFAKIKLTYHESDNNNRGNYYFHYYLPTHMDVYCLEPVSHLIDSFNRNETAPEQPPHNGVRVLEPGQSFAITAHWQIID